MERSENLCCKFDAFEYIPSKRSFLGYFVQNTDICGDDDDDIDYFNDHFIFSSDDGTEPSSVSEWALRARAGGKAGPLAPGSEEQVTGVSLHSTLFAQDISGQIS